MAAKEFNHHSACLGGLQMPVSDWRQTKIETLKTSLHQCSLDFFGTIRHFDFCAVANFGSGLTIKHVDFDQEQLWFAYHLLTICLAFA